MIVNFTVAKFESADDYVQIMLSGEPYLMGYLENIEEDLHEAGFAKIEVNQPIPGRAEAWFCHKAPVLPKRKSRKKRVRKTERLTSVDQSVYA